MRSQRYKRLAVFDQRAFTFGFVGTLSGTMEQADCAVTSRTA